MLYKIGRAIFTVYFGLFNKISVKGEKSIPESGGLIICANHIHWLDPVLLAVCVKRQICYMAKAELFKNKFFYFIMKNLNAFPVKRGTPDISAIKNSLRVIKEGKVLGIFPEGTRSRDGKLKPAEPGVALIAVKTDAPVVPVMISGNYKLFGKIEVSIGNPISFTEYKGKKLSGDETNELSQSIMKEIARLV